VRRSNSPIALIFILTLALIGPLALTACRRATPTPIPVAQTLTRIAATAMPTPAAVTPTTPGTIPHSPAPTTPTPPPGTNLIVPAWLLDSDLLADLAAFLTRLHGNHTELHLLPANSSKDAQKLLTEGQAQLAILTDPGATGNELLRQIPFVLASHLAAPPLNLTLAELRALFAGPNQDSRRVLVVSDGAVERDLLELDTLRPDAALLPNWPAVVETLLADRQAVALLPWAFVTPRLRLHPVDGHTLGPGVLTDGYPLVQRWRLAGDATADPALRQTIVDGLRADFTPPVSLITVGDIMLARRVGTTIGQNGVDYPFAATADWLRAADLVFGNLETPISNSDSLATDGIAFLTDPSVVNGLSNAGFDALALANNHIGDYGPDALLETIQLLEASNILPVGAGANETTAREPKTIHVRGLEIALLARTNVPFGAPPAGPQTPGAAWFDPAQTLADLRAASEQADIVVLSLHWGNEYTYTVTPEQRAFVQEALAAGADLILGHHSHNAQALNLGQNWLAAYSLGNFVFDQNWSVETSQGLALRLLLDETGVRAIEPVVVYVVAGQPHPLTWDESKALLADTFELTEGLPPDEPAPPPAARWTFQTGGRVTGLASGDLDGDGGRELIAATGSLERPGTVYALRDGQQLWQFQTDARINAVRATDLDADGRDEILLATGALDQPGWLYALNGNGAQLWRHAIQAKAEDVIAADLDSDSRRKKVLGAEWGSFDDTIRVLGADGALHWAYETSGTPNRLLAADLNNDGASEIVVGGDRLYALNRLGGLQWKQETESGAYVTDVTALDLDGDGPLEIIAGTRYPAPAISVYEATGALRWTHPLSASVTTLAVADLSGDGRPEIVAGAVNGAVAILDAGGAPQWQTHVPGAVNRLAAADLNGDGAVELVVAAGDDFTSGGVAVLAADGSPLLWCADAGAVTALHVGPLSSERYEIVAGTGDGWVYPVDWTDALPTITAPTPTPMPVVNTVEPPPPPSSPAGVYRPTQASYDIKVELDYERHTLQAQERLTFTNTLSLPLADLLLNVPPNRFAGAFALSSLTVDGQPALHALEDTSLRVTLPAALLPDQAVTLEMTFSIQPPYMRVGSIFGGGSVGYSESAFNAGNWYPVLAPYRADEGWQAISWHPVGDPYVTDVAAYVVEIRTSPDVTVVGPGTMEHWPDEGRWRFAISAARAFAFAASHRYESVAETAYGVTIASYYYPEHRVTGQLILANATASVRLFSDLYGPYPYPDLRIAETDFSGGQEFSGFLLFGSGMHQDYLDTGGGPRTVLFTLISHETAHQWWYGVVGNDQAREPWLDEALAKYSEQLFYERLYPEHADWRWAWMGMANRQPAPLDVTIYDYSSEGTYKDRVYLTGALFLAQLRQTLGDDAFFSFIRAYYRQSANRIVTTDEFLSLLSQYGDREAIQSIVAAFFERSVTSETE
jgi:poly-gamma-glutamate capsule biosynthesis protein CapA/YwtB (metallophosphatase superfamily)